MATLYELCDEMIELQDMMEDPDVDAGAIKHAMELKKDEICSKAVGYLKVLANTTADRTAIHEEIARLTEREKKKKTKEAILAAMQLCGVDKIETSLFTAKAKLSNGSVTITDEELLDPKFIKEKRSTSIDKTAIKKAILAGEDVEGASIEKTLSLIVS